MTLIVKEKLLAEYDREHVGPPGRARQLIEDAPPAPPRVVAEIRIDGEALQRCVDEAVENMKRELFGNSEQLDIIHCKDCIYYDPPHVENNDIRIEYADLPKEAFDTLGTGLVTLDYGINVGGRCTRDYNAVYNEDKRVFVPEDNFCGRAERRPTIEKP